MNRSIKMLTLAILFLLASQNAFAQNDTVRGKLDQLTEETTVAVLYVDVASLKPAEMLDNARKTLETVLERFGLDLPEFFRSITGESFDDADFQSQWNSMTANAEAIHAMIRQVGVKECFAVATYDRTPIFCPGYLAIPRHEKLNVEMLTALPYTSFRVTDDFVFLTGVNPLSSGNGQQKLTDFGPKHPVDRPDFSAALDEVGKYSVWCTVTVPAYWKKVMRDLPLEPPFPELRGVDLTSLLAGTKYKAVGVDLSRLSLHAVAVMESANAAEAAREQVKKLGAYLSDRVLDYAAALDEKEKAHPGTLSSNEWMLAAMTPEFLNKKNLDTALDALLPKPVGDRFLYEGNLAEMGESALSSVAMTNRLVTLIAENFHEQKRNKTCMNHLKTLAIAMHNHYDMHGSLPPAYTVDENGKPLHSWRVALLPFVEAFELHQKIRLNEPWDSEYNRQFHDQMPSVFFCSSYTTANPKSETPYCMIVGPDMIGTDDPKGLKFDKITDGTSCTVVFVERKTPLCWMAPVDISQDDAYQGVDQIPTGIGSYHPGCVYSAFCDGSVRKIPRDVALDILKAILTKAGGETKYLP